MLNNIKFKYETIEKIILIFSFISFVNIPKIINIDNLISESYYQKDLDFSEFDANLKVLAVYYPRNYINIIDYIDKKTFSSLINEKNEINLHKLLIKKQVKLAKNHGIFGFGIVYNLMKCFQFNEEILDLFSDDNMHNFHFFIILNNLDKFYYQNKNSLNSL